MRGMFAAAMAMAAAATGQPLDRLNKSYISGKAKSVGTKKTKAVQKRRKANKAASKQRKSK